jgi:hypothetical protein
MFVHVPGCVNMQYVCARAWLCEYAVCLCTCLAVWICSMCVHVPGCVNMQYVCARAWLCEYAVCLCTCGHVSMSFSVQRLVFVLCVSSVGKLWLSPSLALRTLISPVNHLQILSSFSPTEKLFWHAGTLLHYMTNSMWTPARWTSHSKIMGINMELVPPLLL